MMKRIPNITVKFDGTHPCRITCPLLAAFQTLAQREANARIRSEYQRLVQIREEKEELQRQQINKRLEEKVALQ